LSETEANAGEFVDVLITDATEYDLVGTAQYLHHELHEAKSKRIADKNRCI